MGQWQFYTPEGVIDYLPQECAIKRKLEDKVRRVFASRGYEEIETSGIEFYDVYAGKEVFTPQETLFKFFDQQGRILCLRYDGTVPAARVAATTCRDRKPPLRFCYLGNMYRYMESGGGRQREFTQAGVELMGLEGPAADAEIIATAIASAQALGIEDLQVSIGQVSFFKGLIKKWELDDDAADKLLSSIDQREPITLAELIKQFALSANDQAVLELMTAYDGNLTIIDQLLELVDYPPCVKALENLQQVLTILADYGLLDFISIDLGMLQSINYYTGIIFKGFTYGLGFPLFSGGRYDGAVAAFGRDLAATGFSLGINFAMAALRRQGLISSPRQGQVHLIFDEKQRKIALDNAAAWRELGLAVICSSRAEEADLLSFEPDQVYEFEQIRPGFLEEYAKGQEQKDIAIQMTPGDLSYQDSENKRSEGGSDS